MVLTPRKWITLLALLAAVVLWYWLGKSEQNFTVAISFILLICGLVLLYLVNVFVSKKPD